MSDTVVDNATQHRFELVVNGHTAAAYYELDGDIITFVHTEVPAELGGQGVGSRLVRGALDHVRAKGWKVVAQCRSSKPISASMPNIRISCRHESRTRKKSVPGGAALS